MVWKKGTEWEVVEQRYRQIFKNHLEEKERFNKMTKAYEEIKFLNKIHTEDTLDLPSKNDTKINFATLFILGLVILFILIKCGGLPFIKEFILALTLLKSFPLNENVYYMLIPIGFVLFLATVYFMRGTE